MNDVHVMSVIDPNNDLLKQFERDCFREETFFKNVIQQLSASEVFSHNVDVFWGEMVIYLLNYLRVV